MNFLDVIQIMKEKTKDVFELNDYFYFEKENKIEIILPNTITPDLAKETLSTKSTFSVKEKNNGDWSTTNLNERHIAYAERYFGPDVKIFTEISFNDKGKILFADITGRNINKELKIDFDNKNIFTGKVTEKIEDGKMLIPHQKIKEMVDLVAQINFDTQEDIIILEEENQNKKVLKRGSFIK